LAIEWLQTGINGYFLAFGCETAVHGYKWIYPCTASRTSRFTPEILKLIAEIDEFKGRWKVIETLAPEKLTTLRRIATIESVGSSTRIEGPNSATRR
jgi:hypothetical protein